MMSVVSIAVVKSDEVLQLVVERGCLQTVQSQLDHRPAFDKSAY